MWSKLWQWLYDKDVQLNKLLGGNKGETISSRLGRHINRDGCILCKVFCRLILLPLGAVLNKDYRHCKKSIQTEFERK